MGRGEGAGAEGRSLTLRSTIGNMSLSEEGRAINFREQHITLLCTTDLPRRSATGLEKRARGARRPASRPGYGHPAGARQKESGWAGVTRLLSASESFDH